MTSTLARHQVPVPPAAPTALRLVAYCRRSTDEQPTTLAVQVATMTGWAQEAGHDLVDVVTETISGASDPEDRPLLSLILERLAAGELHGLVVTTTDRLARTTAVHRLDYYGQREGWSVLILDALDRRDDPEARLLHGIRVSLAEYERALIARRTRSALAYRRAQGVRLGRPRRCPDDVLALVLQLHDDGATTRQIAAAMNSRGHRTAGGGERWWPSHVSRLLNTQDAQSGVASFASRPLSDSAAEVTAL